MSPATFSTPIDRTGTGSAARLCNVLLDEFRQFCLGDGGKQTGFKGLADNTALVSIDFDSIADARCRRGFQPMSAS
jgi:hypothetical protein